MSKLASIQIGIPTTYDGKPGVVGAEKPWTTAIYKEPIEGIVAITKLGIEGDGQADLKHHGGHDKALCVYTAEHYDHWQKDIGLPSDFSGGAFGENLTVAGLDEQNVCLGDVWQLGTAQIQVSQPRQPCWKLARRWEIKDLALQVQQNGYTGWYMRVLQEGSAQPGDPIELIDRPEPTWLLERANKIMHHDKKNAEAAAELAQVPLLSSSWKEELQKRIEKLESA